MHRQSITIPEALAGALCSIFAVTIAIGYLWGRSAAISPWAMAGLVTAAGAVITASLLRRASSDTSTLVASVVVFASVLVWLLSLAWPTLVPPGRGPDLTHHLMLVDFLERHWRLPDASLVPVMVEMAHYTPGIHLLAALAGAWTRTDGFHAVYFVLAVTVALKCVFVFLIATRLLAANRARVPYALAAVVFCALPAVYFIGAFVHDSFLAQVAAELFAVAMLWCVVVWDARPATLHAVLFAAAGVAAFLSWPMWIGPPVVTLAAVVLTHEAIGGPTRLKHLAIALGPIAIVAMVHTTGRVGWLAIAGTTGIVFKPSVTAFGWPFILVASTGLALALFRREGRVPLLFTLSIAAQAATLYLLAQARGAAVPYMSLKMMYLIIYPLAVVGASALAWAIDRGPAWLHDRGTAAWAVLIVACAILVVSLTNFSKSAPVVSSELYEAGRWARGHVEAACVDYLVPNHETMHWLHLAVLGNPRTSLRTIDPSTFDPEKAVVRWIEPSGLPYAIAHMPTLPNDVLNNVDVLEEFGTAAVVRRRGPSSCADAQRLVGVVSPTP